MPLMATPLVGLDTPVALLSKLIVLVAEYFVITGLLAHSKLKTAPTYPERIIGPNEASVTLT